MSSTEQSLGRLTVLEMAPERKGWVAAIILMWPMQWMERVPLAGLKEQSKHGEVLGLEAGRAFDGAGGVDVGDDGVHLGVGVAELDERAGDGVVDDLDHAAADELLVLDEGEIGLDAGGVAVHHEADGAGGGEDGDLGVAVAVLLAVGEGVVPGVCGGLR